MRTVDNVRDNRCYRQLWSSRWNKIFVCKRIFSCWNYSSIVMPYLWTHCNIENRRRDKLSSSKSSFSRPHTSVKIQEKIQDFRWELFNHPPYSCDLVPSDYFLFLHFKKWLGGQRFENDKELRNVVENWFNSQAASFYSDGLRKLVKRYEKCLEVNGDYVEKWNWLVENLMC